MIVKDHNRPVIDNVYLEKLLPDDQQKFLKIYAMLAAVPCTEGSLIKLEILYFDLLTILRNYSSVPEFNGLLLELDLVHETQYKIVQNKGLTIKNRTTAIRKFKNAIRQIVRKLIK